MKWKGILPTRLVAIILACAFRANAATEASSQSVPTFSHLLHAVAGVGLASLISVCLAGMACRYYVRMNREPSWSIAWVTTAFVSILTVVIMLGLDFFRGQQVLAQNPIFLDRLIFAGLPSIVIGCLVAFVIVLDQREQHLQHLSEERRKHIQRQRKKAQWRFLRWLHATAACLIIVISTWWCFSNFSLWSDSGEFSAPPIHPVTDFATLDAKEKVRMFEKSAVAETTPARIALPADRLLVYAILLGVSGVWLAFTIFRWRGDPNTRLDRGLILWAKLR